VLDKHTDCRAIYDCHWRHGATLAKGGRTQARRPGRSSVEPDGNGLTEVSKVGVLVVSRDVGVEVLPESFDAVVVRTVGGRKCRWISGSRVKASLVSPDEWMP